MRHCRCSASIVATNQCTTLEAGEAHPAQPDVPWINNEVRIFWSQFESFEIDNGVLSRKCYRLESTVKYRQIIMPSLLLLSFSSCMKGKAIAYSNGTSQYSQNANLRTYPSELIAWVGYDEFRSVKYVCLEAAKVLPRLVVLYFM